MSFVRFNDLLEKYQPDLHQKNKSQQSQLSSTIINLRLSKGIDLFEFADLLKLSPERYLKFEYGDTDIPIAEYKSLIEKIKHQDELLYQVNIFNLFDNHHNVDYFPKREFYKVYNTKFSNFHLFTQQKKVKTLQWTTPIGHKIKISFNNIPNDIFSSSFVEQKEKEDIEYERFAISAK